MTRRSCLVCSTSLSGVCDGECYSLDPACRPGYYYYIPTQETHTVPDTTLKLALTEDSAARKDTPMARGLLDYFPAALAYVSTVSAYGNRKHNPESEELIWTRGKSNDHADTIMRHLADRGLEDDAGIRHSGYVAWRALAMLQEELEQAGLANPGRAAVLQQAADPPQPDMVGDGRVNGLAEAPRRIDCGGLVLTPDMLRGEDYGTEFVNYAVEPFVIEATCCYGRGCNLDSFCHIGKHPTRRCAGGRGPQVAS